MKKCRKCDVELSEDNWTASRKKNNNYICKPCGNTMQGNWRKANKESYNASHVKYMRKMKKDDEYRLKYNAYFREYNRRKREEDSE